MTAHSDTIRSAHPRAYEPWRPVDEVIIRAMAGASASAEEVAERIGRTEAEITAYLEGNGLGETLNGRRRKG